MSIFWEPEAVREARGALVSIATCLVANLAQGEKFGGPGDGWRKRLLACSPEELLVVGVEVGAVPEALDGRVAVVVVNYGDTALLITDVPGDQEVAAFLRGQMGASLTAGRERVAVAVDVSGSIESEESERVVGLISEVERRRED
jgi:hypothetical protein